MTDARDTSLIVVGPGERLDALAAALGGLLARAGGARTRLVALEDLAGLLLVRAPSGVLLLDFEQVPAEDVGILRRFLEARPGWTCSAIGAVHAKLPRLEPLAWPPDLDALSRLASGGTPRDVLVPRPPAAAAPRPAAAGTPSTAAGTGAVDLVRVLDDVIVGRAVGEHAADYGFEPAGELRVAGARDELAAVAEGFLGLAEACAGRDRRVDVAARADGGHALVEILFPPGALTDGDLPALLDGTPFSGPPELREAVQDARAAAALAEDVDGRVRLSGDRGRLKLELRLPLSV